MYITGPGALVPVTAEVVGRELELPASNLNLRENTENIQLSDHLIQLYNPALMDNALALALREGKKAKGFNFRREEFQIKTQFVKIRKELTRASIYLGIILVLLAVTQTFPEVTKIVDPLHQMNTKINELINASGATPGINLYGTSLEILNDISSRIPADLEIQVDRMVVDQDGVQIRGSTDTFNTVDSIKKGLESSEMYHDVIIASANLDKSGKGVRFEIKMARTL
jgi:general secretion pathway protein L